MPFFDFFLLLSLSSLFYIFERRGGFPGTGGLGVRFFLGWGGCLGVLNLGVGGGLMERMLEEGGGSGGDGRIRGGEG